MQKMLTWTYTLISFKETPKCGMTGSNVECNFRRNYQTVFQSACKILHSLQKRWEMISSRRDESSSSSSCLTIFQMVSLFSFRFRFSFRHSSGYKLTAIGIFLMTDDVELLFTCLLPSTHHLRQCLLKSVVLDCKDNLHMLLLQ